MDTPDFRARWENRLGERRDWSEQAPTKRERSVAKLTQRQVHGQLRDLAKVAELRGVEAAIRCVDRAANGHWQGVVYDRDLEGERMPGRQSGLGPQGRRAPGSTSAQLARAAEMDEQEPPSIWGRA